MDRFATSSTTQINELIDHATNKNTTKATNQWMRCYHTWATLWSQEKRIETLPPTELDQILQVFYAEVKKTNGEDFEPNSLSALQNGIERYLKDRNYNFSILRSTEFKTSRSVLEGKARLLREAGKGKRPNKRCSLTSEEEEQLWKCGTFGSESPIALINTLWWLFTLHFGLRGRQEHHDMKVEDFTFKKDDYGTIFLTYAEGITKTRQSGLHDKHTLSIPKMFETKSCRCPIKIFKLYLSKRPLNLRNFGPFYLSPRTNPVSSI